eukprot:CAMPEP_0119048212 /NCGR_PEP_ID=MMETSP1177-20130426/57640_1 /TAXON_ID=2985 /ORGANISM="Ochromonas sp, Strain CCMP1899" /LENGTH=32 /DNA_ID= /DNA_START= /DNA_END= /DNA_ORIENTATION=
MKSSAVSFLEDGAAVSGEVVGPHHKKHKGSDF